MIILIQEIMIRLKSVMRAQLHLAIHGMIWIQEILLIALLIHFLQHEIGHQDNSMKR